MNLQEAIDEVFTMADEMTGAGDPEYIEAQRMWLLKIKRRVLDSIDMRKLRDSVQVFPRDYRR